MSWKSKLSKLFGKPTVGFQNDCSLCGDPLDNESELKLDCGGGHCWECLSEIEADGFGVEVEYYRRHHDEIWLKVCEKYTED